MNTSFSLARVEQLFKKQFIENYKIYLMSLSIIVGSELFIFFIHIMEHSPISLTEQISEFIFFLFAGGAIFTSTIFSEYAKPRTCSYAISLPATQFEKYFVKWMYSFVIFLVVMVAEFYLTYGVFVKSYHPKSYSGQYEGVLNLLDLPTYVYMLFLLIHSVFFYGAIYFSNKVHFIKTAFAVLGFMIIIEKITEVAEHIMVPEIRDGLQLFNTRSDGNFFYKMDPFYFHQMLFAGVIVTILLWVAAYFRLQEKQVR